MTITATPPRSPRPRTASPSAPTAPSPTENTRARVLDRPLAPRTDALSPPAQASSLRPRAGVESLTALRQRGAKGAPDTSRNSPPAEKAGASATPAPPAQPRTWAASAVDMAYQVSRYAFKGYIGLSAMYVPVMAGSMLYLGARHPGDLLSHPGQTLIGGASFSNRITWETVQEGRANVMAAFGSHIPADSACHTLVPVIGLQSPDASVSDSHLARGMDGQPISMYLHAFAPNAGALHTVHHEYVHCMTHPGFDKATRQSEHWRTLNEALTEYFADQLPGSWIGKLNSYDFRKLANGKRWKAAAAELESAVGKEVLRKAFFGGDPQALSQVTDAVLDVWPKRPNFSAWPMVRWLPRHQQQALGECFVGLSLLDQQKLPATSHSVWASQLLPAWTFDSISKQQARRMQEQAEEARNRFGRPFDRAFCHTDPEVQTAALQTIGEELAHWWKNVL